LAKCAGPGTQLLDEGLLLPMAQHRKRIGAAADAGTPNRMTRQSDLPAKSRLPEHIHDPA
jgi:hypothetical protein